MRICLLVATLLSCLAGHCPAVDWSVDRDTISQLDNLVDADNRQDFVGAVLGIARRGNLEFCKAYGYADPERQTPLSKDSVFYIASCSKQFTAAAFAILMLDGKVAMNDEVQHWFPNYPGAAGATRFHNLIHHTSGIEDYGLLRFIRDRTFDDNFTNADVVKVVLRENGLRFEPSTRYEYCNSNYILLASAIERISQTSLPEFTRRRLFKPLSMSQTHWQPRESESQIDSYLRSGDQLKKRSIAFSAYGDGNLWSSVPDLAKWDGVFYPDSKIPGLAKAMLQQSKLVDGTSVPYAFGLRKRRHGTQTSWSHGGQMFGYQSSILRIPEHELCVIVLANSLAIDADQVSRQVSHILLGTAEDSRDHQDPTRDHHITTSLAAKISGEYYDAEQGRTARVEASDENVTLNGWHHENITLSPTNQLPSSVGNLAFTSSDGKVVASFNVQDDTASEMSIKTDESATHFVFKRLQRQEVAASDLAGLIGRYHCKELDTTWSLQRNGKVLTVMRCGHRLDFRPLDKNRFEHDAFDLTFHRGDSGLATSFSIHSGSTSEIQFTRRD